MKRLIVLALCTGFLVGCNSDDSSTLADAQMVSIDGRVYLGDMNPGQVNVSWSGGETKALVDNEGSFFVELPASEFRDGGITLQAQGYIDNSAVVLHSQFNGNDSLLAQVAEQDYVLSYHEFSEAYVSPVSEAYFQLPDSADGDWLLQYAAAVKLYVDAAMPHQAIDLTALAENPQAMTDFATRHSEGGFDSPMATAIAEIEQDDLLALNLRDERLYGEFYWGRAVPERFARNGLNSYLTLTESTITMPDIRAIDGQVAHTHVGAAWNRVANRIFVEQTEAGLKSYTSIVSVMPDDPAYDAWVAKTGSNQYEAVFTEYVEDITVVSAQQDEILLRVNGYVERSGVTFEYEGESYEIEGMRFGEGVSTMRLWRFDDAAEGARYSFDVEPEQAWVLPNINPANFSAAYSFNSDGSYSVLDVTGIPLAAAGTATDLEVMALFEQGSWSLHDDNTRLRLEATDEQGETWFRDVVLTRNTELGFEAVQRVYREGETFARISGGLASAISNDFANVMPQLFERVAEPYLASLVNQSSGLWQDEQLRPHEYFGWWLFENGNGAQPQVRCNQGDFVFGGPCDEQWLQVANVEALEWSLMEGGTTIRIDRYADLQSNCSVDSMDARCGSARYIMPLSINDAGDIRVFEWQVTEFSGEPERLFGPRLNYYHVMDAPEFFERPEYADDPEPGEQPEPIGMEDYAGVEAANIFMNLGSEYAGAAVAMNLAGQALAFELNESGFLSALVPLDFEPMPQRQLLDVRVDMPGKPFELRQITSSYSIKDSTDVGKYLNFELAPTVLTTAHAAVVDLTLQDEPLTARNLLRASIGMPGFQVIRTAELLLYWYETPSEEWGDLFFPGIEALLASQADFEMLLDMLYDVAGDMYYERLLFDSEFAVDLIGEGWTEAGNRLAMLRLAGFGAHSNVMSDLAFATGDRLTLKSGFAAQSLIYPEIGYWVAEPGNFIEPFSEVETAFQREPTSARVDQLSWPSRDIEEVLDAWMAKHDGENPQIEFERERRLDFIWAAVDYQDATAVYREETLHDLPPSFEHEGTVYQAEARQQMRFEEDDVMLDIERHQDAYVSMQDMLGAQVVFGTLTAQGFTTQQALYSFQDGGTFIMQRGDGAELSGQWQFDDGGRVLLLQVDDMAGTVEVRPFVPENGTVIVDYRLEGELLSRLPTTFVRVDEELPPGMSPVDTTAIYDDVTSGLLIADMWSVRAYMLWGPEVLPTRHSLRLYGLVENGLMGRYSITCIGEDASEGICDEVYDFSPEDSAGNSALEQRGNTLAYTNAEGLETRFIVIGGSGPNVVMIQEVENANGSVTRHVNFSRLLGRPG